MPSISKNRIRQFPFHMVTEQFATKVDLLKQFDRECMLNVGVKMTNFEKICYSLQRHTNKCI